MLTLLTFRDHPGKQHELDPCREMLAKWTNKGTCSRGTIQVKISIIYSFSPYILKAIIPVNHELCGFLDIVLEVANTTRGYAR
jgi:hypothetical protein